MCGGRKPNSHEMDCVHLDTFFSLSLSVSLCEMVIFAPHLLEERQRNFNMRSDPHPFSISLGYSNSCEVGTAAFNQLDISKVAMCGSSGHRSQVPEVFTQRVAQTGGS